MNFITANFSDYAERNYTNTGIPLPRGFFDGTKLNSVYGDQQDALNSPLRSEFFSELVGSAAVLGAVVASIDVVSQHDTMPGILIAAGSTAVAGVAAWVRQRAAGAIQAVSN